MKFAPATLVLLAAVERSSAFAPFARVPPVPCASQPASAAASSPFALSRRWARKASVPTALGAAYRYDDDDDDDDRWSDPGPPGDGLRRGGVGRGAGPPYREEAEEGPVPRRSPRRPPPPRVGTRVVGDGPSSAAAEELRRMPREGDGVYGGAYGDELDPVDEGRAGVDYEDGDRFDPRYDQGEWNDEYDDGYDDDDDYDYYDDEDDEGGEGGNFWSNPRGGLDPFPSEGTARSGRSRRRPPSTGDPQPETKRRGQRRRRPASEDLYGRPPRRPGAMQKTTFRSGTPPPPPFMKDFYDRFFWYGFDANETTSSEDRTMFGGTKGKFRGLDILRDYDGKPISRRDPHGGERRRADRTYDGDDDGYGEFDDDYYFDDDGEDDRGGAPPNIPRPLLPGLSMDEKRSGRPPPPRSRRRRGKTEMMYDGDDFDFDYGRRSSRRSRGRLQSNGDWAAGEVSSWFEDNEEDSFDEEEADDWRDSTYGRPMARKRSTNGREKRRGGRRDPGPQSLLRIVDSVFGLDPDDIGQKARDYDQKIRPKPQRSTRATDNSFPPRRRKGYAYRYVDDDGLPPVAEYGPVEDAEGAGEDDIVDKAASPRQDPGNETIDTSAEEVSPGKVGPRQPRPRRQRRRQRTWEDRESEDIDRVPPSGVTAWGPTGEVMGGIDARTQAALMAMEEIREAKRKVEDKEERVISAEEKVLLLKAKAAMQRNALSDRGAESKGVRAKLRRMNHNVEDAARVLRRARAELDLALDRVADLEDRHCSLLSQVEADETFKKLAASSTNKATPEVEEAEVEATAAGESAVRTKDVVNISDPTAEKAREENEVGGKTRK